MIRAARPRIMRGAPVITTWAEVTCEWGTGPARIRLDLELYALVGCRDSCTENLIIVSLLHDRPTSWRGHARQHPWRCNPQLKKCRKEACIPRWESDREEIGLSPVHQQLHNFLWSLRDSRASMAKLGPNVNWQFSLALASTWSHDEIAVVMAIIHRRVTPRSHVLHPLFTWKPYLRRIPHRRPSPLKGRYETYSVRLRMLHQAE